ncbi:MAG: hypothetical protein K2L54_05520, partial [Clostridiales bacterium]|nr:hypothetical protein [Clostridiales bacterium]
MKKLITIATVCALSSVMLCGCSKPARNVDLRAVSDGISSRAGQSDRIDAQSPSDGYRHDINIKIDGNTVDEFFGVKDYKPLSPGVRRIFAPDYCGTYTVEYIHVPYGIERDDTLDFNLKLNDDDTFTLKVVSKGVESNHYGHWYRRHSEIMLLYDDPIDPTEHNVYVADSMYGELLPNGKI